MTDLPISPELAQKLVTIAHEQSRTLEELLSDFIEEKSTARHLATDATTLLKFAKAVDNFDFRAGQNDISERFDEYAQQAIAESFDNKNEDEK